MLEKAGLETLTVASLSNLIGMPMVDVMVSTSFTEQSRDNSFVASYVAWRVKSGLSTSRKKLCSFAQSQELGPPRDNHRTSSCM